MSSQPYNLSANRAGPLLKWANYAIGWQSRHFVLKDGTLSYFKSVRDSGAGTRGSMAIAEATIARKPGSKREVVLTASHAVYHLRADTEQELMSWLISLQLAKANGDGGGGEHGHGRASRRSDGGGEGYGSAAAISAAISADGADPGDLERAPLYNGGSMAPHGQPSFAPPPPPTAGPAAMSGPSPEMVLSPDIPGADSGGLTFEKMAESGLRRSGSTSSIASTFSEASDWSGEHSAKPAKVLRLGGDYLAMVDSSRSAALISTLQADLTRLVTVAQKFDFVCKRHVAQLDGSLIGPEPGVEAQQDKYICKVKAAHAEIVGSAEAIIHLGAVQSRAMRHSAHNHEHEVLSAVKRVEAMHHLVAKIKRLIDANQKGSGNLAPGGATGTAGTEGLLSAPLSGASTGLSSRRGSFGPGPTAVPAAAADANSPPTSPASPASPSSSIDDVRGLGFTTPDAAAHRTPRRSSSARKLAGHARDVQLLLQAPVSWLPNRRSASPRRHRRSFSDPLSSSSPGGGGAGGGRGGKDPNVELGGIDARLAAAEASVMQPAEHRIKQILSTKFGERIKTLSERDCLQIIRGYSSDKDQVNTTIKATDKILRWRVEMDFGRLTTAKIGFAARFHKLWRETIYGEDLYGHPLVGIRVADIDTDAMASIPEPVLLRLVAQKLAAYRAYMDYLSTNSRVQRYKLSYLIDMKGAGVSGLLGERKALMQKIFGIGSDYFPESAWKIYVVNAPFALRMGWSVVKALIHPVTEAKIKIIGSTADATAQLKRDGFTPMALPLALAGTNPGLAAWDLLKMLQPDPSALPTGTDR